MILHSLYVTWRQPCFIFTPYLPERLMESVNWSNEQMELRGKNYLQYWCSIVTKNHWWVNCVTKSFAFFLVPLTVIIQKGFTKISYASLYTHFVKIIPINVTATWMHRTILSQPINMLYYAHSKSMQIAVCSMDECGYLYISFEISLIFLDFSYNANNKHFFIPKSRNLLHNSVEEQGWLRSKIERQFFRIPPPPSIPIFTIVFVSTRFRSSITTVEPRSYDLSTNWRLKFVRLVRSSYLTK